MQIKDDKKADSKRLFQRLKELFWQTPFRNSVSLLTLLIAVTSALILIYEQSPLMIVALVHLLPLVVVITDSVRDKLAGKPLRWPIWLLVLVYGAALIGTGGLALSVFGGWKGNNHIYTLTFALSTLAVFITLLPRLLNTISILLAAIPSVGVYIKKVVTPAGLYIALLIVTSTALLEALSANFWSNLYQKSIQFEFKSDEFFIAGIGILYLLPAVIWRKLLWQENSDRLYTRLLPHLSAWLGIMLIVLGSKKSKVAVVDITVVFSPSNTLIKIFNAILVSS